ncbi:unnamed protein product [Victoria cruziana]
MLLAARRPVLDEVSFTL